MSIRWAILHVLWLTVPLAGRVPADEAKPRAILAGVKPTQISAAHFSPDGKTLALRLLGGGVMLRDMASGKIVHTIEAGAKLGVVVFSPDSRLLATTEVRVSAERKQIKVWDVRTGKQTKSVTSLGASIFLGFTPDSASLVIAQQDELKQMSLATGKESTLCKSDNLRHGSKAICPDGKTLAVLTFEEIRFLDLMTGKELTRVDWDNFGSTAFSGDGKTLAWVEDGGRIHVFDIPAGKMKTVLQERGVSFGWIGLSHKGKTLYCQTEEGFERRNIATGSRIEGPEIATAESRRLAFSPHGKLLATLGRDEQLRLWEIDSGKEITSPKGHAKPVMSLAFAPDGKTLASSATGLVLLWDVGKSEIKKALFPREGALGLLFSPDGKSLLCGGSGWMASSRAAQLWDVKSGETKLTFEDFDYRVLSMAFSHDGKTLALGSFPPLDKRTSMTARITLWDPSNGKRLRGRWRDTQQRGLQSRAHDARGRL